MRARHVDVRLMVWFTATWVGVGLLGPITLAFIFPSEVLLQMTTTAAMIGLMIPATIALQVLDEGAPHLVATAPRNLIFERLMYGLAAMAVMAIFAVGVAPAINVQSSQVVANSVMLTALGILGGGVLGSSLAGVPVVLYAFTFTFPRLIPPELNLLYREDNAGQTLLLAVVAGGIGLIIYCTYGSRGLIRQRLRKGLP